MEAAISESQKRKATASGEEKATGGRRRAGRGRRGSSASEAAAGDTWRVAGHSPFAAAVASSRTKRCRCHRAVDQSYMGPENLGFRPIGSESQPEVSIRPIKYLLYWAHLAVAVEASSVEALLQGLGPFQAAADRQLSARLGLVGCRVAHLLAGSGQRLGGLRQGQRRRSQGRRHARTH